MSQETSHKVTVSSTTGTVPITTRSSTTVPTTTRAHKTVVTTSTVRTTTSASHTSAPSGTNSGKTSTGAIIGIVVAAVIVLGLVLMFLWNKRTKQRRAQRLPRTSVFFGPTASHANSVTQPSPSEKLGMTGSGAVPSALMPSRTPAASIRSQATGSEFTVVGNRSVYVENAVSPAPDVEARKFSRPGLVHPDSLPSPYEVFPTGPSH